MNRILKELALNKVRFRHICRPSMQIDEFLSLKLKELFGIK